MFDCSKYLHDFCAFCFNNYKATFYVLLQNLVDKFLLTECDTVRVYPVILLLQYAYQPEDVLGSSQEARENCGAEDEVMMPSVRTCEYANLQCSILQRLILKQLSVLHPIDAEYTGLLRYTANKLENALYSQQSDQFSSKSALLECFPYSSLLFYEELCEEVRASRSAQFDQSLNMQGFESLVKPHQKCISEKIAYLEVFPQSFQYQPLFPVKND